MSIVVSFRGSAATSGEVAASACWRPRQLMNYARKGDEVLALSVSGSSPNVRRAAQQAKQNGLQVLALVGGKSRNLAQIADQAIVIDSTHYGRAEDAHMGICHMLCDAFIEEPRLGEGSQPHKR